MKHSVLLALALTLFLTGCGGPGKRPSHTDIKEEVFEVRLPFITFHQFECNFVDNPENAKENRYDVYVDMEISFSEPLYMGYQLRDPLYYQEHGLTPLIGMAIENTARRNSGEKGLSPILWKHNEAGERFKMKLLVKMIKTEKKWLCPSYKTIRGSDTDNIPASLFSSEYLIWGSPEHLAELAENNLNLPSGG